MNEMKDTWRLYGLVPYNISPIQQGIQYGHALQELNNKILELRSEHARGIRLSGEEHQLIWSFDEWSKYCKTFIILNGGTTNKDANNLGSMNVNATELLAMGIDYATFYEPDLGDQLTGVVFLVPNTVYDKKLVPDFWDWEKAVLDSPFERWELSMIRNGEMTREHMNEKQKDVFDRWSEMVGGEKWVKLRFFLSRFRLA